MLVYKIDVLWPPTTPCSHHCQPHRLVTPSTSRRPWAYNTIVLTETAMSSTLCHPRAHNVIILPKHDAVDPTPSSSSQHRHPPRARVILGLQILNMICYIALICYIATLIWYVTHCYIALICYIDTLLWYATFLWYATRCYIASIVLHSYLYEYILHCSMTKAD
jgi:hypothetical protein